MNWTDEDDQMLRADLRAREAHSEVFGPPPEANAKPMDYWIGETHRWRETATEAELELAALRRRLRWWVLAVFALAGVLLGVAARAWVK